MPVRGLTAASGRTRGLRPPVPPATSPRGAPNPASGLRVVGGLAGAVGPSGQVAPPHPAARPPGARRKACRTPNGRTAHRECRPDRRDPPRTPPCARTRTSWPRATRRWRPQARTPRSATAASPPPTWPTGCGSASAGARADPPATHLAAPAPPAPGDSRRAARAGSPRTGPWARPAREPVSHLHAPIRHVTEHQASRFRHVMNLGVRRPTPRRQRSPRAASAPRTPVGGKSGGSSPCSGRCRTAGSPRRTRRTASRPRRPGESLASCRRPYAAIQRPRSYPGALELACPACRSSSGLSADVSGRQVAARRRRVAPERLALRPTRHRQADRARPASPRTSPTTAVRLRVDVRPWPHTSGTFAPPTPLRVAQLRVMVVVLHKAQGTQPGRIP